jgi:hypothetical protein
MPEGGKCQTQRELAREGHFGPPRKLRPGAAAWQELPPRDHLAWRCGSGRELSGGGAAAMPRIDTAMVAMPKQSRDLPGNLAVRGNCHGAGFRWPTVGILQIRRRTAAKCGKAAPRS